MKDHDREHLQSDAAAATKRKQRERRLPEELLEIQMNDTAARAIARADPDVRQAEQQRDTAARALAREQLSQEQSNQKKFFPLSLSHDEVTGQYKFDQPCGLWNKPCAHGCGYIHFSAATTGTLARCCAGGLLSSNSINTDMDLLVNYELDHLLERCVMKPAVRFPPIMTLAARFPLSNCIMKLTLQSLFNSFSRERCMRFPPLLQRSRMKPASR